jgi:hypothetical protein
MKNIYDTVNFSPIEFNKLLLKNQKIVERAFIAVYRPESLHELVYIILAHILNGKLTIQKCKLCGKYFVNYGNSDYVYCNRPYDDEGKTCREVGSSILYKMNRFGDPVGREFDRTYKKFYARKMRGKMTDEDFNKWSAEASNKYAAYKENKYSGDDFVEWLKACK